MSSVLTGSQFMFLVMVIVVLLTFTIDSFNSAPIGNTTENVTSNLSKRAYYGDMTWYNLGLGSCGTYNNDNELACALPKAQFDKYTPNGNPNRNTKCGKRVKVTRGSKSVIVKIVDRCEDCNPNSIDLSPAAFKKLVGLLTGRTKCSWQYV
ncbi:4762_t:CDS:2 [Diversispora eburnea]|uniref:4762_t:CDS:1 n=1 Tax=Diversispora eburnea TaxID=1213867 RepID=A0A9N9FDS4_9GLOM|nr:4762_t:CDS:2 [Diversispora eburnea]